MSLTQQHQQVSLDLYAARLPGVDPAGKVEACTSIVRAAKGTINPLNRKRQACAVLQRHLVWPDEIRFAAAVAHGFGER